MCGEGVEPGFKSLKMLFLEPHLQIIILIHAI